MINVSETYNTGIQYRQLFGVDTFLAYSSHYIKSIKILVLPVGYYHQHTNSLIIPTVAM